MKSYNFIESANQSLKSIRANIAEANREYTSLSRVLKDIQRSDLLAKGYRAAFEGLNVSCGTGKKAFQPKAFDSYLEPEQRVTITVKNPTTGEKEEKSVAGIWGYKAIKDAEGNVTGTEEVCRPVKSWTPNKVFKVLAQANAIKAQKAEEAGK